MSPALEFETESDLDAHLFRGDKSVARSLGWLTYHTLRSKGSQRGFPDRFCTRDRNFFVETKGVKTPIQPEQVTWLDRIVRAGGEVYLWRPVDVDDAGLILGYRWQFVPYKPTAVPCLLGPKGYWLPPSLWIPDVGRADALPNYSERSGIRP